MIVCQEVLLYWFTWWAILVEITRLAVTTFALTFGVILPSTGGCKVLIGKEDGNLDTLSTAWVLDPNSTACDS